MGKHDNKKKRHKKRRKRSLGEAAAASTPGSASSSDLNDPMYSNLNGDSSSPHERESEKAEEDSADERPAMVMGTQNRVRATVEFVFPRSVDGTIAPYIFDRQRKRRRTEAVVDAVDVGKEKKSTGSSSPVQGDEVNRAKVDRAKVDSKETIDDILFGATKSQENSQQCSVEDPLDLKERGDNALSVETSNEREETAKEYPVVREGKGSSARMTENNREGPLENGPSPRDTAAREMGHLSGFSVEDAVRDRSGCRPRANSTDGELNLPRRGLCDERSVLECYRWKDVNGLHRPRGFVNCGNTCFLNATLQCLAYLPPFAQCLLSLPRPGNGSRPVNNGQRMTWLLSALFRRVHGTDGEREQQGAISPRAIVNAVPSLGSGGNRSGYKFRPGRQEDAHEFLIHLLDAMHDGELKAAGINPQSRGWRDRLPIPHLDETTFIHRIFGGYLRSQVRCTKCGYRSNTYDPFLDLALEVSKKSCESIATAFAEFTRKETLDSDNRWKCSGCKKNVRATKQLTVFRGPLALCVQLKRFTYGGGFGGFSFQTGGGWGYGLKGASTMIGRGSKITKPIDFPAELHLPLSDGRKCAYGLSGIVIHVGGSSSSGHYTAFVKRPTPSSGSRSDWYHMDDSFVEPISEKAVLRHRDAYLLFYCRKEVKLEFPTPPPRASMTADEAKELGIARARARADSIGSINDEKLSKTPKSPQLEVKPKAVVTQPGDVSGEHVRPPSTGAGIAAIAKKNNSSGSPTEENEDDISNGESGDDISSEVLEEKEVGTISHGVSSPIPDQIVPAKSEASSLQKSGLEKGKTRVVVDRGSMMGKLEVMVGQRHKGEKAWKPKSTSPNQGNDLLGTLAIETWGDDDDEGSPQQTNAKIRRGVMKETKKEERVRKRKMHLDRWDATLDEGKTKKVKDKSKLPEKVTPNDNKFLRIQSSVQRMNRGHAKGRHHRTPTKRKSQSRAGRASF